MRTRSNIKKKTEDKLRDKYAPCANQNMAQRGKQKNLRSIQCHVESVNTYRDPTEMNTQNTAC